MTFAAGLSAITVINRESGLQTLEVGSGREPLVLLHGYGSSAREWLPYTQTVRVSRSTRFIFPEAPGTTVPPDGPEGGRAWWRLDLASYRRRGESIPDLSQSHPAGLDEAAARMRVLLKEIRRRLDAEHTILGGFSHGAMVAADIAFRTDEPLAALVILSGTSVDEQAWVAGMPRRKNLPVFIAHGRKDPVLKFDVAVRLEQHMRRAGLRITWAPFDGSHEFPANVVTALNAFLSRAAPRLSADLPYMFLGHVALGLAAKRVTPNVSLALLILACQLADAIWPILLAIGLEQVRIDPGNTAFTPLDFVGYPYSHSLLLLTSWGIAYGLACRFLVGGRGVFRLTSSLVVSHWLLDAITHRPDLPLYPGGPKVGWGLWNSIPLTLAVELTMYAAGLWIYLRATRARDAVGRWAFAALAIFLVCAYLANLAGAPPSVPALYVTAIVATVVLTIWSWWADPHRIQRA